LLIVAKYHLQKVIDAFLKWTLIKDDKGGWMLHYFALLSKG